MLETAFRLAAAFFCIVSTYVVVNRWRFAQLRQRAGCKDPARYKHKDPIFGLDLFFRNGNAYGNNCYLEEMTDMHRLYGDTFEALDMGRRSIYTIEPENLSSVFTSNATNWGIQPIRLAPMAPFCGRGFLTVDGDLWHRSRKMFQPSFDKKAIADFSALDGFLQTTLSQIPSDGTTVDMQPLLSSLFVNATTLFLFGESIGQLSGSVASTEVSQAFDQAMFGSGMRIALGPLGFLAKTRKWTAACKRAQSFADAYVEKAIHYQQSISQQDKPASPRNTVLLRNLAEQTSDKEHLRNEILQAFFVSQGTTANCITNVLFLVAREPGMWQRLREETTAKFPNQMLPDYEQLQRLPYLRNVVKEALRVFPVLPQNNRVALNDTILPLGGGADAKSPIFVQKGTVVSISYYNLHRNTRRWGIDADTFRPERWEALPTDIGDYDFLPFGAGPRQCIGRDKAQTEALYVLVRLLQRFNSLESRDSEDWRGRVQLSAQNLNGCKVAFSL